MRDIFDHLDQGRLWRLGSSQDSRLSDEVVRPVGLFGLKGDGEGGRRVVIRRHGGVSVKRYVGKHTGFEARLNRIVHGEDRPPATAWVFW